MKFMNLLFLGIFAFGAIGCGSSTEDKVDKANNYIDRMNSMMPTLARIASTDLSNTTADDRADMKDVISDYLGMANYVINVANRDDVYSYGISSLEDQRSDVQSLLSRIQIYERELAEVTELQAELDALMAEKEAAEQIQKDLDAAQDVIQGMQETNDLIIDMGTSGNLD